MNKKPELVAPGGNFEKVKIAYRYGADAVYVGGLAFGLRKSAQNLSPAQLQKAVDLANEEGRKLYVVLNGYTHQDELAELPAYLDVLEKCQVHALIISDLGTLSLAQKYTTRPLHTSTQASVSNWKAAEQWKKCGAKRVVVARECSITECKDIQEKAGIEVETFIHGAMCVSYSGKCTISNYSSGRDSNRGGCIQSCRHPFSFSENGQEELVHLMNAKDLMGVSLIPEIKAAGLHSLKIEGRMKSNLYLANTVAVYRDALDQDILQTQSISTYEKQLSNISNRGFSSGSLEKRADSKNSISANWNGYSKGCLFIGTIKHQDSEGYYYADIKSPFNANEQIELLHPQNKIESLDSPEFLSISNTPVEKIAQNSVIKFKSTKVISPYTLLQKPL